MTDKPVESIPESRENPLNTARALLRSSQPSSVKAGIDQVRKYLQDNPEDKDAYRLLLDAAKENPPSQDEIRNLLQGQAEKSSTSAAEALRELNAPVAMHQPETSPEVVAPVATGVDLDTAGIEALMRQADDAYYATEYGVATPLYRLVLARDPSNLRARQQINKITLNQSIGTPNSTLPRDAIQYYRQARSHIAAEDFGTAVTFLNMAVEKAHEHNMRFPEAEAFLDITQNQKLAAEYKEKAEIALQAEKWEEAFGLYNKSIKLDSSDEVSKEMRDGLQGLFKSEALLDPFAIQLDVQERKNKLNEISTIRGRTEEVKVLVSATRYQIILAKYNLYKTEAALPQNGLLRVLASQREIKKAQTIAKGILKPDDPALKYIAAQLKRLWPAQIGLPVVVIILAVLIGFAIQPIAVAMRNPTPYYDDTPTVTATKTSVSLNAKIPVLTLTKTFAPSATITPTATVTITATETRIPVTPSLTPKPILFGFIDKAATVHYWDIPNSKQIGIVTKYQIAKLLDKKNVSAADWYLCEWDSNGSTIQGWILAEYINTGPLPASRMTATTHSPILFTPTITFTVTAQPSEIPSLTLNTPTPSIPVGYIKAVLVHYFDEPNGVWKGEINRYQVIKLLEEQTVSGSGWCYCEWDTDGMTIQGWILAQYIEFGPLLTSTPTITPTATP